MSFNNNQFSVRWTDDKGEGRSKVYSDYNEAVRAFKWLQANGADNVDLAIIVKRIQDNTEE